MSRVTKGINRVTGTIIGVSGKLIVYALVLLLLVEGVSKGYAFGYEIFHAPAMEAAPGHDVTVTIPEGQSNADSVQELKDFGLIDNVMAVRIQMRFYDYDAHPGTYTLNTSMTSKEILQALNEEPEKDDEKETAS